MMKDTFNYMIVTLLALGTREATSAGCAGCAAAAGRTLLALGAGGIRLAQLRWGFATALAPPDVGGRTRCAVRTGAALLLLCVLGVLGMGENKKER